MYNLYTLNSVMPNNSAPNCNLMQSRRCDHRVEALRGDGRADLPDTLREQLAARERTRTDLGAAEAALSVLSGELVDARRADGAAGLRNPSSRVASVG